MKIGTISFYGTEDNYGCILQCFALPRFLNKMGNDAFFIKSKYINPESKYSYVKRVVWKLRPWLLHPFKTYALHQSSIEMANNIAKRRQEALEHPRGFESFMENNIPSTDKVYDQFELMQNPPYADAYICGSDQIWGGINPNMYLRFAPNGTKKISYAPSFGGVELEESTIDYIRESISDFDLVSVREQSGVDLCINKLGRGDAILAPDPTLLLRAEEYRRILNTSIIESHKDKPYVFLYLLGNTMSVNVDDIMSFASREHLAVKYVASGGRIDKFPKIYPSVEEWLRLLDDASYVITNSFHGTVFSLLFEKKFITIPLEGEYKRMNVRLDTLLDGIGLKNRVYDNDFNVLFEEIDFTGFRDMQIKEIERISNLINTVLKK